MVSAASALSKSTQPTTPAMNGCWCASSSMKRVSSTVGAACTSTVAPTPARASCGARCFRQEVPVDRRELPASASRSRRDPGARSAGGCRPCLMDGIMRAAARARRPARDRAARARTRRESDAKTWRRNCVLRRHWRIRPPRWRCSDAPAETAAPRPAAAQRIPRTALRVCSRDRGPRAAARA